MRKLRVRHQRLPGIGEIFRLDLESGLTVTVATHRSGRRDLALAKTPSDTPQATTALTRAEAAAVAALLTGAHIELATTPPTG